ncbi:MAG: hypothetical protein WBF17_13995, partial [Phycisphaerae bacterium]
MNRRRSYRAGIAATVGLGALLAQAAAFAGKPTPTKEALSEVLVYPTREDGSIMHWLAVSPLTYNAAYIGDSMSYDVFKGHG